MVLVSFHRFRIFWFLKLQRRYNLHYSLTCFCSFTWTGSGNWFFLICFNVYIIHLASPVAIHFIVGEEWKFWKNGLNQEVVSIFQAIAANDCVDICRAARNGVDVQWLFFVLYSDACIQSYFFWNNLNRAKCHLDPLFADYWIVSLMYVPACQRVFSYQSFLSRIFQSFPQLFCSFHFERGIQTRNICIVMSFINPFSYFRTHIHLNNMKILNNF